MSHLQRRTSRDWFLALRPWFFPASTMPVLLSLGYYAQAGRTIDIPNALIALVSVVLMHAAGNLWSDVFDFKTGVDAKDTEGVRVLAHGRFTIGEYLALAAFLGALGVAGAVWLAFRTDFDLLWATAAGVAAAILYPPLKYRAWGDAVIFFAYTLTPMFAMSRIVTGGMVGGGAPRAPAHRDPDGRDPAREQPARHPDRPPCGDPHLGERVGRSEVGGALEIRVRRVVPRGARGHGYGAPPDLRLPALPCGRGYDAALARREFVLGPRRRRDCASGRRDREGPARLLGPHDRGAFHLGVVGLNRKALGSFSV